MHDEFARQEDETRDLVEALGKLSRETQASPGFAAQVMAQADQMPTPRRHPLAWLQSLPFSRMADRILAHAPSAGGSDKGEGSLLGGVGRMLDGN